MRTIDTDGVASVTSAARQFTDGVGAAAAIVRRCLQQLVPAQGSSPMDTAGAQILTDASGQLQAAVRAMTLRSEATGREADSGIRTVAQADADISGNFPAAGVV